MSSVTHALVAEVIVSVGVILTLAAVYRFLGRDRQREWRQAIRASWWQMIARISFALVLGLVAASVNQRSHAIGWYLAFFGLPALAFVMAFGGVFLWASRTHPDEWRELFSTRKMPARVRAWALRPLKIALLTAVGITAGILAILESKW
jgi:uncharacterized BrkB/YihY/UPF0761 family membrane protein